jgi:hypothetical protein
LIEIYVAGASVGRVEDVTEVLQGTRVSFGTRLAAQPIFTRLKTILDPAFVR